MLVLGIDGSTLGESPLPLLVLLGALDTPGRAIGVDAGRFKIRVRNRVAGWFGRGRDTEESESPLNRAH